MATSRENRRRRKAVENAVFGLAAIGIYGWLHYSGSARTQTWAFSLGLVAGYGSSLLIIKAEARDEQTGARRHAALAILLLGTLALATTRRPDLPNSRISGQRPGLAELTDIWTVVPSSRGTHGYLDSWGPATDAGSMAEWARRCQGPESGGGIAS